MAKKETKNEPKDLIEAVPEEVETIITEKDLDIVEPEVVPEVVLSREEARISKEEEAKKFALDNWVPKTALGRDVRSGKAKDYDKIVAEGKAILEPQIVDSLLHLQSDLLLAGQSKGKFGGGKRRAWRQTQKKTMEGNVVTFSTMAVVGDKNGHVGIGIGKAKETLPARDKAIRNAKLSIITVKRGFEDPLDNNKSDPHTIPFVIEGKCGSVRIKLMPAPRGTGLVIGDEGKKILRLAGIRDVYAFTRGQTRTTLNLAEAVIDALSKTTKMRSSQ